MKRPLIILFSLVLAHMAHAQNVSVDYTLGMSRPSTHLMEIGVTYRNLPTGDATLDLILPVWRSGRYVIFDFAGGVQEFSAVDGNGRPLPWSKVDKTTWRVQKKGATTVTARYKMFANEFNARTKGLNDEHLFVDPMSSFMYVEKYRKLPLTITIVPYGNWRVTTGLDPVPGKSNTFSAPSYDYFADCPIEVGTQKEWEFDVDGTKHVLMIAGEGDYDAEKMVQDIAKIVKGVKEFWGSFPYTRYVFMLHVSPTSGGGTEHINSTIMGARPFIFKNPRTYRDFLGLVTHEFFHTWNVKQLRPKALNPYDFTKENYTQELWIAEGTTDYYDLLIRTRLGLLSASDFLADLAERIRRDRERPGNTRQSAVEASFDAWVKYWRNTEEAYNYETDYYDKGASVSLLLDLEIRNRSNNKRSLDDVMRTMLKRFPLSSKGYTVADFQKVAEEHAGSSLKEFFEKYVFGTASIDWEEYLSYAGLQLVPTENSQRPWLGIALPETGSSMRIARVVAGSPAYEAGVNVGDEVVALNGYRVRPADVSSLPAEMREGDKVRLTVFRNERLREFEITLTKRPVPAYTIQKSKEPTALEKSIYESWLKAEW